MDGSNSDREVFVLGSWLAGCVLLRGTCEKAGLAPCVYRVTCRVDYTSKSMCTGTKKKMKAFIMNMIILFYFPRMI